MYSTQRANNFFFRYGCPATMTLIAIYVISFFSFAILQEADPFRWLAFYGDTWPQQFWRLFTWPLRGAGHPINVLFACLWAYWVCGSLERSWGMRTFLAFFFGTAALTALTTWLGGQLLMSLNIFAPPVVMAGLFRAVAAPTVAWCTINSRETICFWGVINIPAPLLAWLVVIIVWFEVGPPLLGLFALSGCAAAYWYARYGRYANRGYASSGNPLTRVRSGKAPVLRLQTVDEEHGKRVRRSVSPLRWWRARQERQKLEKLWNRSISQDPPDEKRRP